MTAFDAIHDQAHPRAVLAGIASALRDDGVFLMVDIKASSHPHENLDLRWAPLLYTMSTMHCMTVSLALDGAGLARCGASRKPSRCWARPGSPTSRSRQIETDPFNNYYVASKR